MISQSNIGDNTILRPLISNPSVCKETIDELVDEITSIGDDIVEAYHSRARNLEESPMTPTGNQIGGMKREISYWRTKFYHLLLLSTQENVFQVKATYSQHSSIQSLDNRFQLLQRRQFGID